MMNEDKKLEKFLDVIEDIAHDIMEETYSIYIDNGEMEFLYEKLRLNLLKFVEPLQKDNAILKAEIRRLEKLFKVIADNSRSKFPIIPKPPLGDLNRDLIHKEAMDRLNEENEDPWVVWLNVYNGTNKMECQHFVKMVKDELELDPIFFVEFLESSKKSRDFSVKFSTLKYDGSWVIRSNNIKDMEDLKRIYNTFKDIYE